MLGKLLKYDLQSTLKFLVIFYVLALTFATATRIFFANNNSLIMEIFAQIFSGATISMVISILINNLMRIWVYFKTNLYGDEGYLMHTLPVPRRNLLAAKMLMGVITLLISIVVALSALALAYLTPESFELIKNTLSPMANIMDSTIFKLILAIVVLLYLELTAILFAGYTGIILGHRRLIRRTGYSVLFGFLVYCCMQIVVLIGIMILSAVNPAVGESLFDNSGAMPDISVLKPVCILAIALYTLVVAANYFVAERFFKKINLD